MHILPTLLAAALSLSTASAYKNWDFYIFRAGCNPEAVDINLRLYHQIGRRAKGCTDLNKAADPVNLTAADSLSWKSPAVDRAQFDLCMYAEGDCSGKHTDVIRSTWEICYPYNGFQGYKVVPLGDACE